MKRPEILILTLMLLVSGNAFADDVDTLKVVDVEEILVIAAPKENRKLREQPAAVTLLSQQEMQAAQVNSIKNLTGIVPNMFIPDYGSRLTSAVYIRGIGSRINTPSVGLYVDNIPYIDKSAFDFDYSDIERIDVLRGPQGTLYGRNAMGGLIKIHTKSPFSYQGTDFRIGAGTHNAYHTSLTHYHRMSERFAFSAGGFYDYESGFFRNAALGNKKIDKSRSAGGRIRSIYLPSENWKVDLNVSYEYSDQGGYPYYYTGSTDPAGQSEEMKPYIGTISNNQESGYLRNLMNAGLNLEYQAQRFTLSAVTGYQFLKDRMFIDQDFTAEDIYTLEQKQRIHTLSEEIVMKSKATGRWQWTTGISGFYQWLKTDAPVTFREDGMSMLEQMLGNVIPSRIEVAMAPGMGLGILPSLQLGGNRLLINGNFDTPLLNGALFHQSTFRDLFGVAGLSFTAGLRLDYEKMRMNYDSGTAMDYTVGIRGEITRGEQVIKEIPMMPETALTVQSRYQGSIDKDYLQLLPKFALQYDLRNNLGNVYATVSKGYRSGGYNIQMFSDLLQSSLKNDMMRQTKEEVLKAVESSPGASYKDFISEKFPDAGDNPDARSATEYKPEQTWNYEAGAHLNLFNGRLHADAAFFWLETRDQQISRFAGASGLGRETVNAGKSRSLGAELALTAAVTTDFTLNASYGYTYATFRDYATNARVNGQLQEASYNGNYVPFVPKHTLTAGGQYTFRIAPGYWLERIRVDARYTGAGRIYWTEENTVSQSFYGTLNGHISFQKGNGQIDFWVRNALDKDYAAFYFESMGNGFMQKGRPIQAGIELRCRF
ncbi:TonB-dependent receptor domain-containing protein [uncultured Bacteroides sp.]|jgi:hypothetical protein|uniref:TonB-dependent receptor n=1 Tax=uncultured Bacteroides sp. TaxID=162156 RepID=UPI00280A7C05|nr:TonB-dependent receptor [uncultured Bacteroides sp.]